MEILTEQEERDQDRWHQLVAQKAADPFKTYEELRDVVETAMEPVDEIEQLPAARKSWLRA